MAKTEIILVEVIYALPGEQRIFAVQLPEHANVLDAITRCGILQQYGQIDPLKAKVGIFGRTVSLDAGLRHGDRVEIYRELSADPKVVRRQRVEKKRRQQQGRSKAP